MVDLTLIFHWEMYPLKSKMLAAVDCRREFLERKSDHTPMESIGNESDTRVSNLRDVSGEVQNIQEYIKADPIPSLEEIKQAKWKRVGEEVWSHSYGIHWKLIRYWSHSST